MSSKKKFNLKEHITGKIIKAIENGAGKDGDKWEMPWHKGFGGGSASLMPQNGTTKRYYSGLNVLLLWIAADEFGFTSNKWGTSKQWRRAGRKLRDDVFNDPDTGDKIPPQERENAQIVFWGTFNPIDKETGEKDTEKNIPMLRYSVVYNECQLEDYEPPKKVEPVKDADNKVSTLKSVEDVFKALNVKVKHRGDRAYYTLDGDYINMPKKELFNKTETPTEAYYSIKLHELMHWTGHEDRMKRDMSGFFGDPSYAFEELVAEIGAAISCSMLGVTPSFRRDHAQYVAHWLKKMKGENGKNYIFNAAKAANKAINWIQEESELEFMTNEELVEA